MASWHVGQLKYALGLGSIMSFYGIVTFIVLMMPEGSVGKNQKVVVIVLILLTLPFTLLAGYLATRRSKKKAAKEAAAAETAAAPAEAAQKTTAPATPQGNYANLTSSAEEVIQFLKSSNLGEGGKDAVYGLPWYLVAGAPKTGKSSLIIGSNLNFQTLPSQRQSEMKFIKPTANVDWRVSSEAVFVDSAGRYQTEGVDVDEWGSLLETVRKYRPNRPIDGFLLIVDAKTILKSDDRQNEELAKVLRSQLDEAMQRLKVRFPVYLIFTNADSIEGFRDSFSSSKQEDKNLVWGATIPIEKSENSQALFDGEYELLHGSVMKRRLVRLSAPFPPVRQLRIFNFPLHFGSGRRKFGAFVNVLFRPNPFSENPFLRGFYFTASPVAKTGPNVPQTVGNTYFTERLFRDVVLRDKDLVRTFLAQRQRPPIFGWLLTFLGAIIVTALLIMSGISLYSNKQMLNEAAEYGERVVSMRRNDQDKDILSKKPDEVKQEIQTIASLGTFINQLDDYNRNGAPILMRFGLYSGDHIYTSNLLPIYFAAVEPRFKAPAVRRMEAELRKFAQSKEVFTTGQLTPEQEQTLDRHYNLLKAYLMLSGDTLKLGQTEVRYRDKAESGHIANTILEYWVTESKIPKEMEAEAEEQLKFWARQVDRDEFPRIKLDDPLVASARQKLQAFPPLNRYYSNEISRVSKEVDNNFGAMTVEGILGRASSDASLITGPYRVPGAFTRNGLDMMKEAIDKVGEKLAEDDWVMGEISKGEIKAQTTDATKLEDLYYRDYSDHWRRFIRAARVREFRDRADAVDALDKFRGGRSPMSALVLEIERNTNLSAATEGAGWFDFIFKYFSKKKDEGPGNAQPEKEFRPLVVFVGEPDKDKNPIDNYLSALSTAYTNFSRETDGSLPATIEKYGKEEDPLRLGDIEKNMTGSLSTLNETDAGKELSALLQQPLENLRTLLGAGIKQQLIRTWNEQLLPEAKKIEGNYPFQDSQQDADIAALSRFLNPADGRFSKFYDERLSKYFEESEGRLNPISGAEVQFADEFVEYLNNAMALRTALFGTGKAPKVDYEFALQPLKDAIVEVTIDGQKITTEGTASVRLIFPAQGGETGVVVNLVSTSGSADSTGTATSVPYQGVWGILKFVDASRPQKQDSGEYLLTFSVGGKTVNAKVKSSGGDIFDRNLFRRLRAPQAFIK